GVTKTISERIHAKRRCLERYGLNLNRHEYREVVQKIRDSKCEFVGRESLRLSHWRVEWGGQVLHAVYDSKHHAIVTFLPSGAERPGLGDKAPGWHREAMEREARRTA
ncbi:MAG TPA: hypothetical protein VN428_02260, partial [Bryobacteraceae bacterium]|nr:hypothetical protein [Bryobacteraceae bacterium]